MIISKYFYNSILFIIVLFFSNRITATETNTYTASLEKNDAILKVILDSSISFKLIDSVTLTGNGIPVENNYQVSFDKASRLIVYTWANLAQGRYSLDIKTVFEKVVAYSLDIATDTSLLIPFMYRKITIDSLDKDALMQADSIQLYYRSTGCFHDYKEKATIKKIPGTGYQLAFNYDSVSVQKIGNRSRLVETPIVRKHPVTSAVVDSLYEMVKASLDFEKTILAGELKCVSTTRNTLFILIGESLFQFTDYGTCNWNLYDRFRKRYFGEIKN